MTEGGNGAAAASWTVEDVRGFLRGYGLSPRHLEVTPLESWWVNLVLRAEADGERLVVRRYGVTPPAEVRWELALLDHLRSYRFPAPAPLAHRGPTSDALGDFLGKPAILYPFIEGGVARNLDWRPALAQTAAAVARLHELTEGLRIPHPRNASGAESRRMIRKLAEFSGRHRLAALHPVLRDMLEAAERGVAAFEERLAPNLLGLRWGVVHHDAHANNVLFRGGRLVALIDFDDAYEGYQVADLAVMIANWANAGGPDSFLDLDRAVTVVREYERHRALTDAERELLPDFVLLYWLGDSAAYVQGCLEQGADPDAAVNDCDAYRRYLHHASDAGWLASFRGEIARLAARLGPWVGDGER